MPRSVFGDNTRLAEVLRAGALRAQASFVGRHYPNLHGDPVPTHGYYFSSSFQKLARLKPGDRLPRHMGPWEFLARDEEGSSSEILQRLRDRHPEVDPYRLSFATSTPVDPRHLLRTRRARRLGYWAVFGATMGLALLALGFPRRLQRG